MVFFLVGVSTILARLVRCHFVAFGQSLSLVVLVVFTFRFVARVGFVVEVEEGIAIRRRILRNSAVISTQKIVVWLSFLVTNSNVNFLAGGSILHAHEYYRMRNFPDDTSLKTPSKLSYTKVSSSMLKYKP